MARHRATTSRRRRIRVGVLGALLLALGISLAGQPAANAFTLTPKGKIITPRNADVVATCKLEVNRVDEANNYATTVTLTANARPAGLDGYRANRFTEVDCWVLPAGDTNPTDALFEIHPSANGPTVFPTSGTATLAYADSYTLCGRGFVKLKDGDTSYTPYVCA